MLVFSINIYKKNGLQMTHVFSPSQLFVVFQQRTSWSKGTGANLLAVSEMDPLVFQKQT